MDTPSPDPAVFLLVPGAGGRGWYWHRVVAELERRGHTAIAPDLPADDPAAGLDVYVEVLVDAAAGQDAVVVVGQSMGALSATLAADRLPTQLLVLVNAMVPLPGETGGQWWEATGQGSARTELAATQGRTVDGVDPLVDFFHDVPDDVVRAAMEAGEPDQSERPFADPFPLRHWPDVPTRVVSGRDDRFFPPDFQRRVAVDRLGITPDLVPGGHLLALSQPVALVDLFEAQLEDLARHRRVDDEHLAALEAARWHADTPFDQASPVSDA